MLCCGPNGCKSPGAKRQTQDHDSCRCCVERYRARSRAQPDVALHPLRSPFKAVCKGRGDHECQGGWNADANRTSHPGSFTGWILRPASGKLLRTGGQHAAQPFKTRGIIRATSVFFLFFFPHIPCIVLAQGKFGREIDEQAPTYLLEHRPLAEQMNDCFDRRASDN